MALDERGSAVVESIFGILILLLLVLGTIQVALTLYARNVVMAAVHDGARAAVELGSSQDDAVVAAKRAIEMSAGSLVDDLGVIVRTDAAADRYQVRVVATGSLDAPGPIPVAIPVTFEASSSRELIDVPSR